MNFDSWNVDVSEGKATHATGFTIVIEGSPLNPMGVNPGKFPENLTAVEQATLLRCGLEALMKAAQNRSNTQTRSRFSVASSNEKPAVTSAPKRKPTRLILSLKR